MVRQWESLLDLTLPKNGQLLQEPDDREQGSRVSLSKFLQKLWGPEGEEASRAKDCMSWGAQRELSFS